MEWPSAEDLLAGPRGRRLCWSLLEPGDYPGWDLVRDGARRGNLTGLSDELAACAARTGLGSAVLQAGQLTLLAALVEPVQTAMYWQEPDDDDHAVRPRAARRPICPVERPLVVGAGPVADPVKPRDRFPASERWDWPWSRTGLERGTRVAGPSRRDQVRGSTRSPPQRTGQV